MNKIHKPFSLKQRMLSFRYAINGIAHFVRNEHNAWIHLIVLVMVIVAGLFFGISANEWIYITLAAGMVLLSEGFNSAIEYLCNFVSPDHHELIGKVKDIAAGSVLIAAITAVIVGLLIFMPYLMKAV